VQGEGGAASIRRPDARVALRDKSPYDPAVTFSAKRTSHTHNPLRRCGVLRTVYLIRVRSLPVLMELNNPSLQYMEVNRVAQHADEYRVSGIEY
jgi:hypothetical protein